MAAEPYGREPFASWPVLFVPESDRRVPFLPDLLFDFSALSAEPSLVFGLSVVPRVPPDVF